MNNYGSQLEDYAHDLDECIDLARIFLNQGCLSYFLGAGASKELGLPNWHQLVTNVAGQQFNGEDFSPIKPEDTEALKKLTDRIKKSASTTDDYLNLIREELYRGVNFDFRLAKKELLIALTALIVGKERGNISSVLTLNFDSVLEWYLQLNGLAVNVTTKDSLLKQSVDIDIIHIHGYLPYHERYGVLSEYIVMSQREFEDFIANPSVERELMEDFFRRHIFLSIGVNVKSFIADFHQRLRVVNKWYKREGIVRGKPYGIAFLSDCTDEETEELIEHGVIPCRVDVKEIPNILFQIAQKAIEKKLLY